MKILMVNQPIGNRGDESAHRALINALGCNKRFDIEVLFVGQSDEVTREVISAFAGDIDESNVEYLVYWNDWISAHLPYRSFFIPSCVRRTLEICSPTIRRILSKIKEADVVLCAPGGVCMGPYRNWTHVWFLYTTLRFGKKLAIYSRSFGPFLEETKEDDKFKAVSIDILKKAGFLSLRDQKSQEYARELGIGFVGAVDTAFLENPGKDIPEEYSFLRNKEYIVFVPNELNIWHPYYKSIESRKFEAFYRSIMNYLISKDINIVMLPQKCKPAKWSDYYYFQKLSSSYERNVTVVPDVYDSGVQQAIIKYSNMVIGARYHSIVFAINNSVPFISLSYEHKMSGMLKLLNLSDMCYDLKEMGIDDCGKVLMLIDNVSSDRDGYVKRVQAAFNKAQKTAKECFDKFTEVLEGW